METAMDPLPESVRNEIAARWLADAEITAADEARAAIRHIPACVFTPRVMADLAACLSEKAKSLSPNACELALHSLDALHDDMRYYE
jgi:hypothetical protein